MEKKYVKDFIDKVNKSECLYMPNAEARYNKENNSVEIEVETEFGGEFDIRIECGESLFEMYRNSFKLYNSFDVSYETILCVDPSTGHGINGAPYDIEDIVADMQGRELILSRISCDLYETFQNSIRQGYATD